MKNSVRNRKRNTLVCMAVMIMAAILFSLGEYWDFTDGVLKEALFLIADMILVILIPFAVYRNEKLNSWIDERITSIQTADYRSLLKDIVKYVLSVPVSCGLAVIAAKILKLEVNAILLWGAACIGLIAVTCWKYRHTAGENTEKVFLSLYLITGTFVTAALPAELGYSWDDQIHYDRMLSLATLDGPYYQADWEVYLSAWNPCGYASQEERAERAEMLNGSFEEKEKLEEYHGELRHYSTISYSSYAAGTILARGLGLSYTAALKTGKWVNMVLIGVIIFFAMKKLKFGKLLAAVIGLIPTLLFMACSFSYDPWVTAWIVLGFAYFFSMIQNREEKIQNRDLVIMFTAFFVGCLPKAVYFVLMFPLLFMPKDRFVSASQHRRYIIAVFAIAAALASTFVLPLLIRGGGSGDARGGEGVNASGQIQFVLSQPLEFARILFRFLFQRYLNPLTSGEYTVNYAYLGYDEKIRYLVPCIVLFTALTDKNGSSGKTLPVTLSAMFALICTAMLVAAALYVSYTPVAHPTVNGCQPRYLLPMIFPALYINSVDSLCLIRRRNLYVLAVLSAMSLISIASIGSMLYRLY